MSGKLYWLLLWWYHKIKVSALNPNTKIITGPNRPLHKRIALHPASIVAILAIGVCLAVTTLRSQALTLDVSAKVSAPPLTAPAIITSPHDQDRFQIGQIVVSGTCPDNSYVKIYDNGNFSGVSLCTNNAFSVVVTLTQGANILQAKDYNITDDEGPESPPITVYYDVPVPPAPPTLPAPTPNPATPTKPGASTGAPSTANGGSGMAGLVIIGDYHYQTHYQGDVWTWPISVAGGVAPYHVRIDWGDGTVTDADHADSSVFDITHIYKVAGIYQPLIVATDSQGSRASLELLAIVKAKPFLLQYTQSDLLDQLQKYLWAAWPAYAIVALMMLSFWLGEREAVRAKRVRKRHA